MRIKYLSLAAAAASFLLIGAGCAKTAPAPQPQAAQPPAAVAQPQAAQPTLPPPPGNVPAAAQAPVPAPVPTPTPAPTPVAAASEVKEFATDSYYEVVDGKPAQFFSLKEMRVKKGDKVRVLINTLNGRHDFVIDELNVKAETPTGVVTTVEFTADKAGEFVYYCSMPNHRAGGQWGTLIVTE